VSIEGRWTKTRCCWNPRLEYVLSILMERQREGKRIVVKELLVSTVQTFSAEEVYVPGLTILDGGLQEGRFKRFSKRIKSPPGITSGINLQEVEDDYNRIMNYEPKIASYLTVDQIIIADLTYFPGGGRGTPPKRPRELLAARIQGRRMKKSPLLDESAVGGKKVEIPLDAFQIRDYGAREWKYIRTPTPEEVDSAYVVDPLDLPLLMPALFELPPERDDLFGIRECFIPAREIKATCVVQIGSETEFRSIPDWLRKESEGGEEVVEEKEEEE